MDRQTIFSGNLSVLLAIIFFVGLSSDVFANTSSLFMKNMFKQNAYLLLGVLSFCSLSLISITISGWKFLTLKKSTLFNRIAFLSLLIQIMLLIIFTMRFILFTLESI